MNFTELKAELAERGFDYLSDTRQGRYINDARAELDGMFRWPYRLTFTTAAGNGAATAADLDVVDFVQYPESTGQTLPVVDKVWLTDTYGNRGISGTPAYAYVVQGVTPSVVLYPQGPSDQDFYVSYYKVPADLTGTDTPLAPTRFHNLIVDLAVERAYRDSDNHSAAEQLRVSIERRLAAMVKDLLIDGTVDRVRTGRGFW